MNNFYTLMTKLQEIEEGAKFSDIPAVQRKKDHPHGWKVSMKDLDAEQKDGKISHPDTLAKNTGRNEGYEEEVEEGSQPAPDTQGGAGAADESIEECGDDMSAVMEPESKGQVSMSMQDLVALINGIQKGELPHAGHDDLVLVGDEEVGEEYGNAAPGASGPNTADISAVTQTGDDLASAGEERPKVNGGGNPMQETLVANLQALYAKIKEAK